MKLTKRRLREIVAEEISSVLNEITPEEQAQWAQLKEPSALTTKKERQQLHIQGIENKIKKIKKWLDDRGIGESGEPYRESDDAHPWYREPKLRAQIDKYVLLLDKLYTQLQALTSGDTRAHRLKEMAKEEFLSMINERAGLPNPKDIKKALDYFKENPEVAKKLLAAMPPEAVEDISDKAKELTDAPLEEGGSRPFWHAMTGEPRGRSERPFFRALTDAPTNPSEASEKEEAVILGLLSLLPTVGIAAAALPALPPALAAGGTAAAIAGLIGLVAMEEDNMKKAEKERSRK